MLHDPSMYHAPPIAEIAHAIARIPGIEEAPLRNTVAAFLHLADPKADLSAECLVDDEGRLTLAIRTRGKR